ncbi:ferritin-4, chloroplastic-like [Asparagus officinalis]|nr:ferritin-4, chloroplastic-like [Asparagus officinalis]
MNAKYIFAKSIYAKCTPHENKSSYKTLSSSSVLSLQLSLSLSLSLSLHHDSKDLSFPLSSLSSSSHNNHLLLSQLLSSFSKKKPNKWAHNSHGRSGVVFQPFEELRQDLNLVPSVPDQSLARQKFAGDCEAAINEQINVEYNISYIYHAMYAYFDRDNIALRGLAHFFKESSYEERDHAQKFMEYQNKRGGRVKLQSILMPSSEFDHPEKGDALYAMELALSLEKVTNQKLINLRNVAEQSNDIQMVDFVDSNFLAEQVESIKKISEYVAQLRRVGKGHGVWHFDQMLLHEGDGAA